MIIVDLGLIASILAVIGVIVVLMFTMGVEGICEFLLDNPQKVVLICTAILFVISILLCCIFLFNKKRIKDSLEGIISWSIPLTLSLSASTMFNIYNVIDQILSLHQEFELALRIIFFIVPLIVIVELIILCIISYAVALSPLILRLVCETKLCNEGILIFVKIISFIIPIILYAIITWLVLTGDESIFVADFI